MWPQKPGIKIQFQALGYGAIPLLLPLVGGPLNDVIPVRGRHPPPPPLESDMKIIIRVAELAEGLYLVEGRKKEQEVRKDVIL